jgi:FkbM family methyltransferase
MTQNELKVQIRKFCARATPFFIRRRTPLWISKHFYFEGKFEARYNGKKILTLVSKGHQIENEIYWRGFEKCHEGLSTQIWINILKQLQPAHVWDVGANSGTYGILAKSILPTCTVTFFEPIPKAAEMIRENLHLNKFTGKVFELALGDFDGRGDIYFPKGADFATSVTVNQDTTGNPHESERMSIEVARAESIIKNYRAPIPQLIKLDVETFEPEVLAGLGEYFPRNSVFLIEILNSINAERLSHYFAGSEYDFYNIDDRNNSMRMTSELEKSDFYNYLVVPKGSNLNLKIAKL